MSDDFMMTAFERKQLEVFERIATALETLTGYVGEIDNSVQRIADDLDDEDISDIPAPVAKDEHIHFNMTPYGGILPNTGITHPVHSIGLTGAVTKAYVDKLKGK